MESTTTALEVTYLKTLIALFTSTAFSADTARASAKSFLSMLPIVSVEDAQNKVEQYVQEYPLFSSLRIALTQQEERVETNERIEKMRGLLARGDINAILTASHEGNTFI